MGRISCAPGLRMEPARGSRSPITPPKVRSSAARRYNHGPATRAHRTRNARVCQPSQYYYVPAGIDAQANPSSIAVPGGSDPYFQTYDPANPPPPQAIAQTTTDQGITVPFIVRLETGSSNRAQYQIAVLFDPKQGWDFADPQPAWNHKLFLLGGPNCGISYQEGAAPGVLVGKVLGKVFATRASSMEVTGNK